MVDSRVDVEYRVKANFSALVREAARARLEMAALNKEAERGGKIAADSTAARRKEAAASRDAAAATKDEGRAARESGQDLLDLVTKQAASTAATVRRSKATRDLGAASRSAARDVDDLGKGAEKTESRLSRARTAATRFFLALRDGKKDRDEAAGGLKKISDGLGRVADARPGGLPPFALIIPIVGSLIALIGPALAGVGALGAAALGLAANIASAASSAAVALPVLAGLATVVGTLRLATGGLGKAITTGDTTGLSKSAVTFVTAIRGMRTEYEALKRSVQGRFFGGFASEVDDLNKILPVAKTGLSGVAGALGTVVGYLLNKISAPAWLRDFSSFTSVLASTLPVVGRGLGSVLDILRNLGMAALPVMQQFAGDAASAAAHIEALVQSGRDSGALTAFLQRSADRLSTWLGIAKNLGATILNYGRVAAPLGDAIAKGLLSLTAAWSKASADALGPNSSFRRYISDITPLIKNLGGVLKDALSFLGQQFTDPENIRQMNALVTVIRTQLGPALGTLIAVLAKSGIGVEFAKAITAITTAITSLLQHGGVQGLKAFWTVVSGLAGALSTLVKSPVGSFLSSTLLPPLIVLAGLALPLKGVLSALSGIANIKAGSGHTGLLGRLTGLGGVGTAAAGAEGAAGAAGGLGAAGIAALAAPIAVAVAAALATRAATTAAGDAVASTTRGSKVKKEAARLNTERAITQSVASSSSAGPSGMGGDILGLDRELTKENNRNQVSIRAKSGTLSDASLAALVKSGGTKDAATAFASLQTAATRAGVSVDDFRKMYPKYQKAANAAAAATRQQAKAALDANAGFKNYTDSASQLAQALDDTQAGVTRALKDSKTQFDNSAKGAKNHKATFDADTQAGRDNRAAFITAMGAIRDHSVAMKKNGSTTQDVRAYTLSQIKTLQDQALKAGVSKSAVEKLTSALYSIPPKIISKVDIDKAKADAALADLQRKLGAINGMRVNIYTNLVTSGVSTGRASQIAKNAVQFGGATGGYVGPWMRAKGYDTGGRVQQAGEWKRGPRDTVPAWLEEGEFVVKREAVNAFGLERLRMINAMTTQARGFMGSTGIAPSLSREQGASTQQTPFVGVMNINSVKPVDVQEALPRALRRAAYLTKGYRR